jgi:TRAP-type mannitol/chloroaromatic compound transport system substrate-binding protein
MKRREFLKKAGVGAAVGATGFAGHAMAQSATVENVQWRMAVNWPQSLDNFTTSAREFCQRIGELSNGKFQIRLPEPGETPAQRVLDAVQSGAMQCGHTATNFYVEQEPAFAFGANVPFGLDDRQQNAWMYTDAGRQALEPLFHDYGVVQLLAGSTGAQMGGWYRNEIQSVADLAGLKVHVGGLAGQVLARLGAVPARVAGGDLVAALDKGEIDAAEWSSPYDDEKQGLQSAAPFYYYPGLWGAGPQLSILVNLKQWQALPKAYQAALRVASEEANARMAARYDVGNPQALRRLVQSGTQLRAFPRPVLEAAQLAANQLYEELGAKSAHWKRIYPEWKQFRDDHRLWSRLAQYGHDAFGYTNYGVSA